MKTNLKILILSGLMILSGSIYSGTMGELTDLRGIYTLSLGPMWAQANSKQTIYLESDIYKTYDSQNFGAPALAGELFAGFQRNINNYVGELGIAIAGVNNLALTGDIWEDADPDFNNYNYKYNIQHAHIAVKARLLTEVVSNWFGYISGSLGVGFNHAHNFIITPKIFEEVPAPAFTNNDTTTFTYTLGLGIETYILQNWRAGIGYQFADLGKSELGRAQGQTLNSGISLNNLYTHQLLFSISYLCDSFGLWK